MATEAVGAVQGTGTTRVNKVMLKLHNLTTYAANRAYNHNDYKTTPDKFTTEGFRYIDSGYGDGFHGLTAGLNSLAEGNGALNIHCKYTMNENGELVPPKHNYTFMA